jgi:large subunit ribosomal protein L28
MARRCDLTDKGVQTGNNVSHSQRKTRRRFIPNIQKVTLKSEALGQNLSLNIAANTLRSIDHNGGLDQFLVTAKANNLSAEGQKLRRKIKKALASAEAA